MPFSPAKLRALRKTAGLSQEALANLLGYHPLTVNRYERGRYLPGLPRVERMAEVLGVAIDDLLDREAPNGHR